MMAAEPIRGNQRLLKRTMEIQKYLRDISIEEEVLQQGLCPGGRERSQKKIYVASQTTRISISYKSFFVNVHRMKHAGGLQPFTWIRFSEILWPKMEREVILHAAKWAEDVWEANFASLASALPPRASSILPLPAPPTGAAPSDVAPMEMAPPVTGTTPSPPQEQEHEDARKRQRTQENSHDEMAVEEDVPALNEECPGYSPNVDYGSDGDPGPFETVDAELLENDNVPEEVEEAREKSGVARSFFQSLEDFIAAVDSRDAHKIKQLGGGIHGLFGVPEKMFELFSNQYAALAEGNKRILAKMEELKTLIVGGSRSITPIASGSEPKITPNQPQGLLPKFPFKALRDLGDLRLSAADIWDEWHLGVPVGGGGTLAMPLRVAKQLRESRAVAPPTEAIKKKINRRRQIIRYIERKMAGGLGKDEAVKAIDEERAAMGSAVLRIQRRNNSRLDPHNRVSMHSFWEARVKGKQEEPTIGSSCFSIPTGTFVPTEDRQPLIAPVAPFTSQLRSSPPPSSESAQDGRQP